MSLEPLKPTDIGHQNRQFHERLRHLSLSARGVAASSQGVSNCAISATSQHRSLTINTNACNNIMNDQKRAETTEENFWAGQTAASQKVLLAGIFLITHGYGRLALLPYIGPAGCWRCEFHVQGRPDRTVFRYTAASVRNFLADHAGGKLSHSVAPSGLAKAIMKSVPEYLRDQCAGDARPETARWLAQLQAEMDFGSLPIAFHEYSEPGDG